MPVSKLFPNFVFMATKIKTKKPPAQMSYPIPSEEEKDIVLCLSNGMRGKDVEEKFGVNKNTMAFRLALMRTKYHCENSTQMVALFLRNGFIQ